MFSHLLNKKKSKTIQTKEESEVLRNHNSGSTQNVMQLQSTIGNSAVLQLLKSQYTQQKGIDTPKNSLADHFRISQPSVSNVPVQRKIEPKKEKPNNTGLPDNLKTGIESLSGVSMDNVRVHYNSSQPAQLNALAYAQETDIHVAPRQERHLPHEAWHVTQQKQGRVRAEIQAAELPLNDEPLLEKEADEMGRKAASFEGSDVARGDELVDHVQASSVKPIQMCKEKEEKGKYRSERRRSRDRSRSRSPRRSSRGQRPRSRGSQSPRRRSFSKLRRDIPSELEERQTRVDELVALENARVSGQVRMRSLDMTTIEASRQQESLMDEMRDIDPSLPPAVIGSGMDTHGRLIYSVSGPGRVKKSYRDALERYRSEHRSSSSSIPNPIWGIGGDHYSRSTCALQGLIGACSDNHEQLDSWAERWDGRTQENRYPLDDYTESSLMKSCDKCLVSGRERERDRERERSRSRSRSRHR